MKLVQINDHPTAIAEGIALRHAIGAMWTHLMRSNMRVFSVRDEHNNPVLTISITGDEMRHCVGLHNRQPTAEELAEVQTLLEPLGITNAYDSSTLC